MEFKISGRHVVITPPIRDYAAKRTEKLHKYFDRIQEIAVVVDQHDRGFEVELVVDVEHHAPFIARRKGEDVYACVDECVDVLERQLTDHKERLRNRKHQH
jgi:putative sigma-54 modulation protein